MVAPTNIYPAVVFDLPVRLKDFLEKLDRTGQIDRDEHRQPYLLRMENIAPSTYQCFIIRNGKIENVIINTRKKKDPVITWEHNDGYKREDPDKQQVVAPQVGPRRERARRTFETYVNLVDQILAE